MNDGDGDGMRGAVKALLCAEWFTDLEIRRCRTRAKGSWNDHEC